MTSARTQSWFRFSLRVLFIVMATICCGLGYELNWIRKRHEFLARDEATAIDRIWTEFQYEPEFAKTISVAARPKNAPGLLWLFGERGHSVVTVIVEAQTVPHHVAGLERALLSTDSQRHIEEAERLFPEAKIATIELDAEPSKAPRLRFPG